MSLTLADFKQRVAGKIHGTSVNKIQDFYGLCHEAAGNLLEKIDPKETIRITQITNALYDQVYDYVAPTDLKDEVILDIRPQANRRLGDSATNTSGYEFDRFRNSGDFTIKNNSGVKTLRISQSLTAGLLLNNANSLTENGTWSAGGNATDLSADSLNKITGSASLKFNISASGSSAYIENSTITAVDMSTLVNAGALFVWCYIPSATIITSVNLRWGSDSSNYLHRTVTATQDNTSFVTGWNLLRFDWDGATAVGTAVTTAIDYARVTFNYDGTAVTSCRVDNVIGILGSIYEIEYQSKYLFRNSSGTWIEKPTDDSDLINLDTTSYPLFLYEVAELIGLEISGKDSSFDMSVITAKKKEVWDTYANSNKSERQKQRTTYYRKINNSRR